MNRHEATSRVPYSSSGSSNRPRRLSNNSFFLPPPPTFASVASRSKFPKRAWQVRTNSRTESLRGPRKALRNSVFSSSSSAPSPPLLTAAAAAHTRAVEARSCCCCCFYCGRSLLEGRFLRSRVAKPPLSAAAAAAAPPQHWIPKLAWVASYKCRVLNFLKDIPQSPSITF